MIYVGKCEVYWKISPSLLKKMSVIVIVGFGHKFMFMIIEQFNLAMVENSIDKTMEIRVERRNNWFIWKSQSTVSFK